MRRKLALCALLAAGAMWAQNGPPQNRPNISPPNPPPNARFNPQPDPMGGQWWRGPQAERVGVSADQRKKLDDLWQQHRLKRVDLDAAVLKAQLTLEPMWQADSPDEGKILAQIDRVTQAQAEVRKDEARMQLGVRQILSADQWHRLQEQRGPGPGNPPQPQQGPNGPPPQGQPRPPQQQPQR